MAIRARSPTAGLCAHRGRARPVYAKTDLCASQTGLGADGAQCSLACTQLPSASQHEGGWTGEIGRWQVNLHRLGLEFTFCSKDFRRFLAARNWTRATHARTVGVGCGRRPRCETKEHTVAAEAMMPWSQLADLWTANGLLGSRPYAVFELLRSKPRWRHRRRPTSIGTSPKSSTGTRLRVARRQPVAGQNRRRATL
jgi:hypothetical protein